MAQRGAKTAAAATNGDVEYDFVRPAGKMENIFIIYNNYGAQSSITSVATYRGASGATLTQDVLFPALKQLIAEHYALRMVAVNQTQDSNSNREVLWEAQLRTLDLSRIVEFVNAKEENLQSLIEATHNEWLDTSDHSIPMWRLKVVNARHVVWYYNHIVADGLSGYAFQRRLLSILNGRRTEQNAQPKFKPEPVDPPPRWDQGFPISVSILKLLWDILLMHVVRFFFGSSMLFADLPFDPLPVTWPHSSKEQPPCKTRVHTLRISADQTKAILACCKAHGTTFGALLHTVAVATAAKDLYPKAWLGLTAMPLSMRPYTVPPQDQDVFVNSVTSLMRIQRVQPYREAATNPLPTQSDPVNAISLNPDKTWEVASTYRKHMKTQLDQMGVYNGLLSMKMIGPTTKEIFSQAMPAMWLYQRNFFSVSNLGAFDQSDLTQEVGKRDLEWTIEDIQFSAAAIASKWGFVAPVFNVAGVKGGDSVINVTIEEGVMSDAKMQMFLDNIERRLKLLVDLEFKKK